jgi:hypothetical protein
MPDHDDTDACPEGFSYHAAVAAALEADDAEHGVSW